MEFKKSSWRLKRECEVNNTEKQRRRDTEREKHRDSRDAETQRGGGIRDFLLKQSQGGKEGNS